MEQLIRILQGDFKTGKCVIRCETEELANEFLGICETSGYKWCDNKKLLDEVSWDNYKSDTCYHNGEYGMEYCEADYYKRYFITVLDFTGFKTKLSDKETIKNATLALNTHPTTTTKETIEIIYHKRETIVLLKSGCKHYKGVVKCHVNDTYNKEQGFVLAYNIARDNQERGKY